MKLCEDQHFMDTLRNYYPSLITIYNDRLTLSSTVVMQNNNYLNIYVMLCNTMWCHIIGPT